MNPLPSTLSVSDARANLYNIVKEVGQNLRRFSITHQGQAKAVIISSEELEGWEETLDIMSNKKLYRQVRRSIKEAKQGKTIPFETVLQKIAA